MELLDTAGDMEESPTLSLESKQQFRSFIQGYSDMSQAAQRRPNQCSSPVSDRWIVDLLVEDAGGSPHRETKADHYTFFSHIPHERASNPGDNSHRLSCIRRQQCLTRAVLASQVQDVRWAKPSARNRQVRDGASRDRPANQSPEAERGTKALTIAVPDDAEGKPKKAWGGAGSQKAILRRSFTTESAAQAAALKEEMRTREACESLRFLVFGTVGAEGSKKRENGAFYEQRIGTKEEVAKLHNIWVQMDEDGSGDVEFQEFLSFFSRSKADRLLGMRCVKFLVGNGGDGSEEKATGCKIEDMMQLMWLKATQPDIDLMMRWFHESQYEMDRVQKPPLLPKKKRREILENFPSMAEDTKFGVSFAELIESGVVTEPTASELWHEYNVEGAYRITELQLLEMLCPNGFRAHEDVRRSVSLDGKQLLYINNEFFEGWAYYREPPSDDD